MGRHKNIVFVEKITMITILVWTIILLTLRCVDQ